MAQEAAQWQYYSRLVDVYSFGIVLWEVCSAVDAPGRHPYDELNRDQHYHKVILGTTRPKMEHWWSRDVQELLASMLVQSTETTTALFAGHSRSRGHRSG